MSKLKSDTETSQTSSASTSHKHEHKHHSTRTKQEVVQVVYQKAQAGKVGPRGLKGDTGDVGADGAQGLKGDTGDAGAAGAQGLKGDTGDAGAAGAQGLKGDTGDAGAQGLKGDTGDAGAQGIQGLSGNSSGLPLSFNYTQPNGNGFETNATGWESAGYFTFGVAGDSSIQQALVIGYSTNTGVAYHQYRLYDITNNIELALSTSSDTGDQTPVGTPAIIDLGTIIQPGPTLPALCAIQMRSNDNGKTIGINTLQLYG